ncbi:uncharacterized protein [Acropora muricata]|uniref:uncharacterized protein isoform X6 n=1 Tax=Acropora muricata TaxID=159855 RepID=UPI0034E3F8A9
MSLSKEWFVSCHTFLIVLFGYILANDNPVSFLDCDFENNTFCEWENDNIGRAAFKWIIWSGKAPSDMTGPQTTDASGNKNGKFAYMDASQRKQGDNVRLLSPKIQGENCLSLMYHMYGGSMGSLIIYLNTSSNETVEWIKSGNHPDQWFEAAVFFNSSFEYQIVLEGVRGSDFASSIAIDNIAVQHGHCQKQVTLTMHAFIKGDGADFKIDRVPAHSSWIHQFSLQAVQTRNSSNDVMYFVYPQDKTQQCSKSVTRQLLLADFNCFPHDFFFASTINRSDHRKVLLVNQGQKLSHGISLDDYPNCCSQAIEDYFFANLALPKSISCPPGWHSLDESCFQLNKNLLKSWADSQHECRQRGGRLATFESNLTTQYFTEFLEDYMEYLDWFHIGARAVRTGDFITIEYKQFNRTSSLWGPGEPSGDGMCSNMLFKQEWEGRWRVNDAPCNIKMGFVCQKKKNTSESKCESSWIDTEGLCFQVYAGNVSYWSEAWDFCKRKGGDLAVVDSELKRKAISNHLGNVSQYFPNMHMVYIGLRELVIWHWLGGSNISSNYWHRGEPDDLKVEECALVARRSSAWKLAKGRCSQHHGFLCQTNEHAGLVAHGVLQEVWHNIINIKRGVISLQSDERFPNAPDVVTLHERFDVYDFDTKIYGQRLTAYLLISESGNYTFYVACDDACILWLHVNQLTDKETEKVLLARTESSTYHNQWDRFPVQKSKETFLSKCYFYRVEMHMVQYGGKDGASMGIKLPNGTYERPIGKNRLLWVRPGNSFVDVKIIKKINVEEGRTFIIQGTYKYCYHGFYSPNCSIDLSLKFAKEKVLVHSALPMDCKEYKFNKSFENILWQKRNYKVYVSYKYVDTEIPLPTISKEVSEILISGLSCHDLDPSHFSCPSGECLRADFLCDSNENCKDGTDEISCGMSCPKDKFSCADGGCVSWTLTCNGEKNCEDGTDEPSFCKIFADSTNCSLLNVDCAISANKDIIARQMCAANKVKCDFEVGFCGMKDESKFHRWQIVSGLTLTKSTGPPFDHTTFSSTGRYMFIGSSGDKTNASAILASGVIHRGEITCIQFWYYMKEQDTSSLKIYIRTNESKTLIWQLMGKQGRNWNIGQVRHQDTVSYQVLLEGSFGSGNHGGIAVDDLYFSNEKECPTIYGHESVPSCFFELNYCDWKPSIIDHWRLSRLKRPVVRYPDWFFGNLGGFVYLQDCSPTGTQYCPARLSSPLIGSGARWKCLKFWLYGWHDYLEVSLVSKLNQTTLYRRRLLARHFWTRIDVPIAVDSPYQVVFKVLYSQWFWKGSSLVALDNMVFLTDRCGERPWQYYSCGRSSIENNTSGYIFSPNFRPFYRGLIRCNWTIRVPYGNTMKLRFLEFQLEDHPSCSNDFIEVYDGHAGKFGVLGRYCGQRFPSFLMSFSNVLKIIFIGKAQSVFKFHFSSEKIDASHEDCIQWKGCPSSCVCFPVSSKSQDMVVTVEKGKEIVYIPKTFPTNTTIIFFQGNKIWHIEKTSFSGLLKLKYLDLSRNHIFRVDDGAFRKTVALETLKLDVNFLTTLPNRIFGAMKNLQTLDCSFNLMKEIPSSTLASLFQLTTLSLRSNRISKIEKNAFNYTRNLIHLYLQENEIEELPNEGFNGLSRLKILDLNKNRIKRLFSKTFAGLSSLEILKMQNNSLSLKNFPFNAFDGLRNLREIYLDEFILCCYAGRAAAGVNCHSPKDEFSSCFDLMKNKGVQVCVWILGLTALLGNLIVLLMRVVAKEDNKVQSILLTNLAISDLLMGIYLLIIAIKDVQWQGEYFLHDFGWRSGVPCAVTGVLSMISSEVSVLMLTVLTTDRLICVVFPFKVRRMNRSIAYAVVGGVWVFGTMLAVIPILGLEYFYDKKRSVGFYGKSAVCLPLQLSAERMAGWEYAVGIFIGLNFVSFVYILVAYIVMFITVRNTSNKVRSTNLKRESQMARRMFFIVLTDFLCWMPVILIGLLSVLGKFDDPEKQAYIWIAVFVLPVNSSINPILYTFSTPDVRRKVGQMKNSLFNSIARKLRRSKVENVPRQAMKSMFGRNIVAPSVFSTDLPSSISSSCNHRSRHNPGTSSKTSHEVQEYGAPEKGLKIVNTSSILSEETSNLVGFVVACRENGKESAMRLIKHFSSECEEDWKKESCLVNELGETEHPNILSYCWHCKAQECDLNFKQTLSTRLRKSAFLLCYDFPESTPLGEYLKNQKIVLNLDTLFVVAMDLIDAIQCLENRGIVHNNITTSTVLIAEGIRVPPVKAILAGFGSSQLISRDFPDCSEKGRTIKDILGKNIVQFGCVLTELMRNCYDSAESDELEGIVHLCSEQDADVRPSASQIGDLLRDLWHQNDIWDTSV